MIDASAFDFSALKEEIGDPFAQTSNNFGRDERFWKLDRDKDGNGVAIIRFLLDSEKGMLQKLYKINTTIIKNNKKRFVSVYSPTSIGLPDPFQEKWQELYNQGIKEDVKDAQGNVTQFGSKTFNRSICYVAKIKVLRDPANPENEGKNFFYEMTSKVKDKVHAALSPSEQDIELGAKPKQLFDPVNGHSFKLVAKIGSNGFVNYDSSEVVADPSPIYNSIEEAIEEINKCPLKLSDLIKPEEFLSYEELQRKLEWVTFSEASQGNLDAEAATKVKEVPEVQEAQDSKTPDVSDVQEQNTQNTQAPQKDESLDALLDGLM